MNTTLNAIVATERIEEFVRAAEERRRRTRPRLPGRARWRGHAAEISARSPSPASPAPTQIALANAPVNG
jgi:hypothetical protein